MIVILTIIWLMYMFYRTKKALHMLQQNLYDDDFRYIKWIKNNFNKVMLSFHLSQVFLIFFILFVKKGVIIPVMFGIIYSLLFIYSFGISHKEIIKKLSLEIIDNDICGIIGKSGSGKTTFLELIDGLLKPTTGNILVNDIDVSKNTSAVRKEIGFVFQSPEEQFFEVNVKKEIEYALKNFKMSKNKASNALKLVGLDESYLNKSLNSLSNGEKRLVAIASILIYNPKIIMFDEPTIGLDYKNKKKIINLIRLLKNRYKKTIIIVSHDVDLLYELCDNIIILDNGKLILYGDPISVFKEDKLIKKYNIETPKIVTFSSLARDKGIKLIDRKNINDLIKEVYRNV